MTPKRRKEIDAKFSPSQSTNIDKKEVDPIDYMNNLLESMVDHIEQREGFTGGEWVRRDLEIIGPYGSNKHICEMTGNFMDEAETEANITLLLQAKNMYYLLKDILKHSGESRHLEGKEVAKIKEILLKANPNH
jgi:hypothetical protein